MSFDARALETLDAIHTDVRKVMRELIPAINTNIAIIQKDINGLQEGSGKLPCVKRGDDIVALGHRTETLETDARKRNANWAEIAKTILAISQALVTAYLISQII